MGPAEGEDWPGSAPPASSLGDQLRGWGLTLATVGGGVGWGRGRRGEQACSQMRSQIPALGDAEGPSVPAGGAGTSAHSQTPHPSQSRGQEGCLLNIRFLAKKWFLYQSHGCWKGCRGKGTIPSQCRGANWNIILGRILKLCVSSDPAI